MQRYSSAIEILQKRLNSGLPNHETKYWLGRFLHYRGDDQNAKLLNDRAINTSMKSELVRRYLTTVETSLRYGMVITTMFDIDVFRSSLLSLLESDYQGKILVVEDVHCQEQLCKEFCHQHDIEYIKSDA